MRVGEATVPNSVLDAVANSLAVWFGLSHAIEISYPIAALFRNIGSTIHHIGDAWGQVAHNLATCHFPLCHWTESQAHKGHDEENPS